MSRPSSYKKRYSTEASTLCLIGATYQILARHFGVSTQTIRNWERDHPEFLEAIKDAKQIADSQVQKSLYKRAIGHKVTEVRVILEDGGRVSRIEKIRKEVPPDPKAAKQWLENRNPEEWHRTNTVIEQQGAILREYQNKIHQDHQLIMKLREEIRTLNQSRDELIRINNDLMADEEELIDSTADDAKQAVHDLEPNPLLVHNGNCATSSGSIALPTFQAEDLNLGGQPVGSNDSTGAIPAADTVIAVEGGPNKEHCQQEDCDADCVERWFF